MADVTSPFGFRYPEGTDLVRNGATDIENLATDVNDYLGGGYLYAGTRYYTSSGTFAKADPLGTGDIGLRAIRVRMVGAGGGGGGAQTTGASQVSGGAGGGSGAYSESFILASSLSSSETVTRGAGGAGGVGSGSGLGSGGGQSSFGSLVTAPGGTGASLITTQAAPVMIVGENGGSAGTADISHPGGKGRAVWFITNAQFRGGEGGGADSFFGGGGQGRTTNGDGSAGRAPGAGGSGGINFESQGTARDGGAGANGIVIIDCFV